MIFNFLLYMFAMHELKFSKVIESESLLIAHRCNFMINVLKIMIDFHKCVLSIVALSDFDKFTKMLLGPFFNKEKLPCKSIYEFVFALKLCKYTEF